MRTLSDGGIVYDADERRSMEQQAYWNGEEKDRAALRAKLRYPFQLIADFSITPPRKHWLIKGIIAEGETSAWIAPPGGMKSALMAQLAFAVSDSRAWHGRMPSGGIRSVVYFALERADLVRRRLAAHCSREAMDVEDVGALPIAVCDRMVDLTNPLHVKDVLDTINAAAAETGIPVNLVIFDTFAKLIAAGGGDEQQARDQGKVFANIQRLKEAIPNLHVAIVGHTGKDETRGARGSNAILGDVDVMVQISGDTVKTATVIKANDMPEGTLFSFTSATHEFGKDEDGDPITVNVVSDEEVSPPERKAREPRLSANEKTVFGILHDAGRSGLALEDWNAAARDAGIGVKRKATLNDIHRSLKSKGMVSDYGGVWTVNHGG
jgi:hypothetical protein